MQLLSCTHPSSSTPSFSSFFFCSVWLHCLSDFFIFYNDGANDCAIQSLIRFFSMVLPGQRSFQLPRVRPFSPIPENHFPSREYYTKFFTTSSPRNLLAFVPAASLTRTMGVASLPCRSNPLLVDNATGPGRSIRPDRNVRETQLHSQRVKSRRGFP